MLLGRVKKKIDQALNHNSQLPSGLKRSEVKEQDTVALKKKKKIPERCEFMDVLNSGAFSTQKEVKQKTSSTKLWTGFGKRSVKLC